MSKLSGFSLLEILATITILAILATITAPDFWRLRDREDYRSEVQAFFDTIMDGRNAAMTNKKCEDGSTSIFWSTFILPAVGTFTYELRCYYTDEDYTVERSLVSPSKIDLELIDFNGAEDPGIMTSAMPSFVAVIFFSGGVSAKLEYNDGSDKRADSVQIIAGHLNSDFQQTICFNRISGFPSLNKSGNTCLGY